jgi:hypothetical protein
MESRHASRYGVHSSQKVVPGSMPGLMYGVLMAGIWMGILFMVAPLVFR